MNLEKGLCMNGRKPPLYLMICDGDPVYLSSIKEYIKELRSVFMWDIRADIFSDGDALFDCLKKCRRNRQALPDVVFLDTQIGQLDGIVLGRRLHAIAPQACLVFITSDEKKAIKGYEANAYRYILKPISCEQILQILTDYLRAQIDSHKWIVRSPGGDLVIELQDILYMSAEDKYTVIHTVDGDYLDRSSLNLLEQQLMEFGFYRIHRKYLVNMKHHKGFRDRKVILADDVLLPLSRRKENLYHEIMKEWLKKEYM